MLRLTTLVILLVAIFGIKQSLAQFDEICHYECSIQYCDPYTDFCDYDCYEVCYPYRSHASPALQAPKLLGMKSYKQTSRNQATTQSPVGHRGNNERANAGNRNARTGKLD
jgi:hypothetical protein